MTAFTPRDGMRLGDFMTEMGRQPFELIDGEKHPKRPTVFDHMLVVHALYGALVPLAVVPDLVMGVLSPTDSYSEVERKVDVYLADGVWMVWAVDPQRKAATAWLANQTAVRLSASDALDGREVLAGFSVSLGEVFATLPAPPSP